MGLIANAIYICEVISKEEKNYYRLLNNKNKIKIHESFNGQYYECAVFKPIYIITLIFVLCVCVQLYT